MKHHQHWQRPGNRQLTRREFLIKALRKSGIFWFYGYFGVACMKNELNQEERGSLNKLLSSTNQQTDGWQLSDRTVKREKWDGLNLRNALLQRVELLSVSLRNCRITDSRFIDVDFSVSDLTGSTFHSVVFDQCKFVATKFNDAKFVGCQFTGCRAEELEATSATFIDCKFTKFEDKESVFMDCGFNRSRFKDSQLSGTMLSRLKIETIHFDDTTFKQVVMGQTDANKIRFHGGSLENTGFDAGNYNDFVLEGTSLQSVSITNAEVKGLKLNNCEQVWRMSMIRSTIENCQVSECHGISEWISAETKLAGISVNNCQMQYLRWRKCEVTGPSSFKQVVFNGANFMNCTISDTEFNSCMFNDFIVLDNAKIARVKLIAVQYGQKIEIDSNNVQYIQSDKFPG